jgi:hypothetical protein
METRNASLLSPRNLTLMGLIVACVLSRLVPHPWNFSPIEATALFAGATLADRRLAIAVPLIAMLLSDMVLGFHGGMPVVYSCMALMAWFGRGLMGRIGFTRVAAYGVASAVFFFIATNLFVWLGSGMYSRDFAGLQTCFALALPFFQNSLAGVAFYSLLLFGGFALLARAVPNLAQGQPASRPTAGTA